MATGNIDEFQSEAPLSKRARLDDQVQTPADAMDDIYSTETNTPAHEISNHAPIETEKKADIEKSPVASMGIPGLGLLGQAQNVEQGVKTPEIHSGIDPSENTVNALNGPPRVTDEGSPHVTTALEAYLRGLTQPITDAEAPPEKYTLPTQEPPRIKEGTDLELVNSTLNGTSTGFNDATTDPISLGGGMISQDIQEPLPHETVVNHMEGVGPHDAEFEVDSSPIESSSDESDSDDSSSSEDSDEDAYKLLGPEEQARILMEGDGGSDDDGGKGTKSLGGQLRTKNEVPEEVIPKPDVTITPTMKIEELGAVEGIIESILLIKAKISGEYRVLESGSVLCLADRTVIGVVSETLGRVQQPLYSVRFTNADQIKAAGCVVGTKVYYSELHSTYVFTQALKAYKGSDASNLHDEEVGDEEVEFSDDEAEAEHKRRLKQKKIERRGGRTQANSAAGRGGHPLQQQQQAAYDPMVGLSYDDEDEGPYKPLARPAGFADTIGRSEAPLEGMGYGGRAPREGREHHSSPPQSRDFHGRGRGGRGDRGRGRGDRGRGSDWGRGRRSFQDRRHDDHSRSGPDGYSNSYHQVPQVSPQLPGTTQKGYSFHQVQQQPYPPPQAPFPPTYPPAPFYQPAAYGGPHPHEYPAAPAFPPAPPPPHGWPNVGAAPAMPSGAFINPAFFGNPPAQQNAEAERGFQDAQEILRRLREGGGSGSAHSM